VYSFLDQPHATLAKGNHFLLWAMRCWILCRQQGRCPVESMRHSFSKMGLDAALRDFDALMHALDDHAIDHLSFADHAYRKITESEAVILALWTDVAANVHDRAGAVLALIVQPEKVVEILERLKRVVGHMANLEFAHGVR
jgi:hypothetical protein